jgi:hypothetical protein
MSALAPGVDVSKRRPIGLGRSPYFWLRSTAEWLGDMSQRDKLVARLGTKLRDFTWDELLRVLIEERLI